MTRRPWSLMWTIGRRAFQEGLGNSSQNTTSRVKWRLFSLASRVTQEPDKLLPKNIQRTRFKPLKCNFFGFFFSLSFLWWEAFYITHSTKNKTLLTLEGSIYDVYIPLLFNNYSILQHRGYVNVYMKPISEPFKTGYGQMNEKVKKKSHWLWFCFHGLCCEVECFNFPFP